MPRGDDAAWLPTALAGLPDGVEVDERDGPVVTLRVPRPVVAPVASALLQRLPVADLAVEDPPIERVIEAIYEAAEVPR